MRAVTPNKEATSVSKFLSGEKTKEITTTTDETSHRQSSNRVKSLKGFLIFINSPILFSANKNTEVCVSSKT